MDIDGSGSKGTICKYCKYMQNLSISTSISDSVQPVYTFD